MNFCYRRAGCSQQQMAEIAVAASVVIATRSIPPSALATILSDPPDRLGNALAQEARPS